MTNKEHALEKIKELSVKYLEILIDQGDPNEKYKYEAINHFQENWNIDSSDFYSMFKQSFAKKSNLFFQNSYGFIEKAAQHFPFEVRAMFKNLYDNSIDLESRIKQFQHSSDELLPQLKTLIGKDNFSSQQDERTISVYLAFKYPDKYILYKSDYYENLCATTSIVKAKTGSKFVHLQVMVDEIVNSNILSSAEFEVEYRKHYPIQKWDDTLLKIQNILYVVYRDRKDNLIDQKLINILYSLGEKRAFDLYKVLDKLRKHIKIDSTSPQLVYGLRDDENIISITIGQRYCLSLKLMNKQWKWGFISSKKLNHWYQDYDGNPKAYYNYSADFLDLENQLDDILATSKKEFERVQTKSGYTKYNNRDFKKSAFDLEFRKDLFSIAFNTEKPADMTNSNTIQPLNQILYGAPGTGKTYKLKSDYFNQFSEKISLNIEKYYSELAINLTWWEVITIILLQNNNLKVKEIASHPLLKEKALLSKNNNVNQMIWAMLQRRTKDNCEFVKFEKREFPQIFSKNIDSIWSIDEKMVENEVPELFEIYLKIKNYQSEEKDEKRYVFTTFHQSMSYEDFIEGIKPIKNDDIDSNEISYDVVDGLFKLICNKAESDPENKYAIFIDEINRGNVSAIFGELITLLEDDKRLGAKNEIKVTLPYSKKEFGVPNNLYVIGTMNTADRSVEALDTALRRRFYFTEMQPNAELLSTITFSDVDLKSLLNTINHRIELLIDKNHQIGHAYFIDIENLEDLKLTFKNKIIPLLEEYFYGDFGKIGLVLGDNFIQEVKIKTEFANFYYEDKDLLQEKKVWKFTNSETWNLDSFKSVYE